MNDYFEGKSFVNQSVLEIGIYENCDFNNCDFSNSNLSGITFIDCEFTACNLSMTKINLTSFKNVNFIDTKLLGLRFDQCNTFGFEISLDNCIANHASFYKLNLKRTLFKNTQLREVDFVEVNLSKATFDYCDLQGAVFENTNMKETDFRTAYNFAINPETNLIKKAKFSSNNIAGLLLKYDIEIK